MMLATLGMIIVTIYSQEAMLMCGPNPYEECLIWADQCLAAGHSLALTEDQNWENCVELLPPELVR